MTAMAIIGHQSEKMFERYNTIDEADLKRTAAKMNTYLTNTSPPRGRTRQF